MKGQRKPEHWKFIKGYEDRYLISSLGKVVSLPRSGTSNEPKIVIPYTTKAGYHRIKLCKNDVFKWHAVHHLVAQAFIPNPFNKTQVNHLDRDTVNNVVENLEWCTPKENTLHYRKSLQKVDTNTKNYRKFSSTQIKEIREKYISGKFFQWELAKQYNTTDGNIGCILRNETYKYVT